ncbi:MAG: winged helix-turn-helix domain-containing protein [Alphaproteobacteria bacterium]
MIGSELTVQSSTSGDTLSIAGWRIHAATHRISKGEKTIKLEPRTMGVLVCLAGRPGKVVKREQLEAAVWPRMVVGYDALSNTIKKLRKAFDDDPKHPRIIETIPKVGYRLIGEVSHSPPDSEAPVGAEAAPKAPEAPKRSFVAGAAALVLLVIGIVIVSWLVPWEGSGEKTLSRPGGPSIAVLPFTNMSGDKEQEYFADGITDDLITDLSKISGLFVVARNSVFAYKGKAVNVSEVGRELGVRYILEGSIRKAEDRVRITAQLVDTSTHGHVWAERYDRDLKDIFALQDEVAHEIVEALAVTVSEDEEERLVKRYTDSVEAYDYYLRGLEYFSDPTREANTLARQMHQKAIDLDPKFAAAYALLGFSYSQEWTMGWSQDPRTLEIAFEHARKAVALDDWLPVGYAILGEVYLWKKEHEKAIAAQEKAIALSNNAADQIAGLGGILIWAGRPEKSIELVRKAMRLNPMYPIEYLWNLGHANFVLGRYDEAIEALKRIRDRNPDYLPAHAYLAASYSELGRDEEARIEAAEVKRLSPQASIETWKQRLPYKDQAILERLVASLRRVGLK